MRTLAASAAVFGVFLVLAGQSAVTRSAQHEVLSGAALMVAERPVAPTAATASPATRAPADVSTAALTGVVQRYCQVCHNDLMLTGNISLQGFDVAAAAGEYEKAERMIRKLRAGMMPPPGMPRPGGDTMLALVETLEGVVDKAYHRSPDPGVRTFQRLNRPEYERAIHDLLALDINAADFLPLDQKSENFDNIADVQALSPTLLGAYLNAASEISRMAIGDRDAPTVTSKYTASVYVSQHPWDYVEGAPYGTRGGIVVNHVFPVDAEYSFELTFEGGRGGARFEDVDISIDGERVALLYVESGLHTRTDPIFIRAGQHRVSAAFVRRMEGPYEDLIRPHDWALAGGGAGGNGITTVLHLKDLIVTGPHNPTGISETPSRQKTFTCRPTSPAEERPCAQEIIAQLARDAYRRALEPRDLEGLMSFYDVGVPEGGFELGVRMALQAILASPHFIFRFESEPRNADAGEVFRLRDAELASRLSFFIWGGPPDEELLTLASQGKLSDRRVLERQTRRMLADPRAQALGERFAAQWLRLQDLDKVRPDPNFVPDLDENIAEAMRTETRTFFNNLVREDRSLLELFTADYTFLNERLARHYGIPDVSGNHFRLVKYPDAARRGLLGQGSMLVQTSLANRTSPVLRGKWVMEVLLGTPPPPPPPNVPTLDETEGSKDGRFLTTRERMELHRRNPICSACHQFMDPIGLALDNFDLSARWRNRENGMPLDTRGTFYDGTAITNPSELVAVLMKRPIPLVRTFTTNLMAYALGRRVEYADQPAVRAIAREAEKNDYRMSSFILGVVNSEAFRMKAAMPVATEADRFGQP